MKKRIKNSALVGIMIMLFSACGQLETKPAPAYTDMPQAVSSPDPVANIPTVVVAAGVDAERFRKYIDLKYPPVPAGLSQELSMMIENSNEYGLWLLADEDGRMLWLNKLTHRDANGNAFWEVKDILDLSNMETGLVLIPDGCFLNGQPDNEIVVVGKDGTILLAWRANTSLNTFEVISTNGIECRSDKGVSLE